VDRSFDRRRTGLKKGTDEIDRSFGEEPIEKGDGEIDRSSGGERLKKGTDNPVFNDLKSAVRRGKRPVCTY
jgi:hypothetical protein